MSSWIDISSHAFAHNINTIKKCISSTQLALVLKGNAYGHGLIQMGQLAEQESDIDWLCTSTIQEALVLRNVGITKPIIALSFLDTNYPEAISKDIHCALYTYETACELSAAAKHINKLVNIHIKIDTGMSRLGVLPHECLEFIKAVQRLPFITLYGIFTHLSDTAANDQSFSFQQLEQFDWVLDQLKKADIIIPCTHALSSSGLSIVPQRTYTLMRAGAALYGLTKSPEHKQLIKINYPEFELQPVLTWQTRIIATKVIPKASYVGYNRTFIATRKTVIAVLPVGYWDGLPRALSNNGFVLIHNKLAPIIGIISMNLMTVDITDIPEACINDTVMLIGDHSFITPLDVALRSNIITNELVSRINPEINRFI